jgi:lactate dehydrogenase-like 2-hydroxyacid dehydrogenase
LPESSREFRKHSLSPSGGPHIGSATIETRFGMAQAGAEDLAALLDAQRPANVVNPGVFG